ncbi:MAG: ATP-binding protein, partial [Anaerolineae bacterium]|nr:ATP-binding protein [Anaerolineae bacterium]
MRGSKYRRRRDIETDLLLADLVRESLNAILVFTGVAAWAWTAFVLLFKTNHTLAITVFVQTLLGVLLAHRLARRHLHLAVAVYLGSLTVAVTIIVLIFRTPAVLYLYALLVPVASLLGSPQLGWAMALIGAVLMRLSYEGDWHSWLVQSLGPLSFLALTALTSWLSSRRLFAALSWALSMAREAHKNAEEARQRRAEVKRVLKSLDEAYVRLERTNEALMLAQEAAEKAYRFKSEFVANVSHELRTPLNLITGFSEMIVTAPESYGGVPLPKEYRGDIMAIYRSACHLSDLIDDVLDLSRIEAGRMPLVKEDTDLRQVIQEATEMVRGLAEARGLKLELDLPNSLPLLPLDRTRIRQVLLNLLTNATRFTDTGGIEIRVRVEESEVQVTVEDSGRGISPERIARAFEAFSQLDDNQAREGSGLGLAVSKRFVEMHGGRMWIESELGRGTAVHFTLPLPVTGTPPQYAQVVSTPPARIPDTRPLVLVLHDDERIISLLERYIHDCRFQLVTSTAQIQTAAHEWYPAAVIADGSQANRQRDLEQELCLPPEVPLITCPLPSMHRVGLHLGASDYLPKPVTREDLEEALAHLPHPPSTCLLYT